MSLLILCLLSLNHIVSGSEECPSPEKIPKCKCEAGDTGIDVDCTGFTTLSLKSHLENLKGRRVTRLIINQYIDTSIPTDLFNGLEIEHLLLTEVEVKDDSFGKGKRHFQGLEDSLRSLDIIRSFVKYTPLSHLQLDHLKKLEGVHLGENGIPKVGNDWFAGKFENLEYLVFNNNGIGELGDKAFSTLSNLITLDINGNHLQSISRSMLPKSASKLLILDLSNNKIHTLKEDIFSGMPKLVVLYLQNNSINQINHNVFSSIFSNLDILDLTGNPLQCDTDMQWICETRLPQVSLGKCETPRKYAGLTLDKFCEKQ